MTESSNTAETAHAADHIDESDIATLRERIVRLEWDQFQRTNNEGGRAACQGNWPVFHQMRLAQFLTWDRPLLESYADDLAEADRVGRNLVTEKYGRMMASTAPDEYARNIEPYIPRLSEGRVARQERVIATQVAWARDFRARYPRLGEAMRVLTTSEDTPTATSFETYLRGELGTYSDRTFALYEAMIAGRAAQSGGRGANITEETLLHTVRLGGFSDLDEAETAQVA
ncbi:DUF4125 family protein [Bifidobacterium stellenboschense]|uniref:DUF4125 domain-containing protein n=1 Tax=Bifidobacterium stellenboschense TaxID=762211 RepID=A0A087DR35_9BIFI|nr:DUF4125 family protein [Bifidobacterium stellenboschense]KFI97985.1 hypothetical protein BSTEL_0745 [Bifidobacterium stellenboschense]